MLGRTTYATTRYRWSQTTELRLFSILGLRSHQDVQGWCLPPCTSIRVDNFASLPNGLNYTYKYSNSVKNEFKRFPAGIDFFSTLFWNRLRLQMPTLDKRGKDEANYDYDLSVSRGSNRQARDSRVFWSSNTRCKQTLTCFIARTHCLPIPLCTVEMTQNSTAGYSGTLSTIYMQGDIEKLFHFVKSLCAKVPISRTTSVRARRMNLECRLSSNTGEMLIQGSKIVSKYCFCRPHHIIIGLAWV